MKINFGEIKKLLCGAAGLLGFILTQLLVSGVNLPQEWAFVIQGIIGVLALTGLYKVPGPTPGTPVFVSRRSGPPAEPPLG